MKRFADIFTQQDPGEFDLSQSLGSALPDAFSFTGPKGFGLPTAMLNQPGTPEQTDRYATPSFSNGSPTEANPLQRQLADNADRVKALIAQQAGLQPPTAPEVGIDKNQVYAALGAGLLGLLTNKGRNRNSQRGLHAMQNILGAAKATQQEKVAAGLKKAQQDFQVKAQQIQAQLQAAGIDQQTIDRQISLEANKAKALYDSQKDEREFQFKQGQQAETSRHNQATEARATAALNPELIRLYEGFVRAGMPPEVAMDYALSGLKKTQAETKNLGYTGENIKARTENTQRETQYIPEKYQLQQQLGSSLINSRQAATSLNDRKFDWSRQMDSENLTLKQDAAANKGQFGGKSSGQARAFATDKIKALGAQYNAMRLPQVILGNMTGTPPADTPQMAALKKQIDYWKEVERKIRVGEPLTSNPFGSVQGTSTSGERPLLPSMSGLISTKK